MNGIEPRDLDNCWNSLLPAFGIGAEFLTGKHTSCPNCGGKDRFLFDNKEGKGTSICQQCGSTDGIGLIMKVNNLSFVEAISQLGAAMNITPINRTAKPKAPDYRGRREYLNKIWRQSTKMRQFSSETIQDCPVGWYLHNDRGLSIDTINNSTGIRVHKRLAHYQGGKSIGDYPAMVTRVMNGNKPSTLHVTYLSFGKKLFADSPKKLLPRTQTPIVGSAIRLFDYYPSEGKLALTEGIESALSIHQATGLPVWSTMNANNMVSVVLPEDLKELHIFADRDWSFTGQSCAYQLARASQAKGIRTSVYFPESESIDWNDMIRMYKPFPKTNT